MRKGNSTVCARSFTHYPQKQETYRFFKGEPAIADRIIILDGSGSVSFDVLTWLAEQDVSLIRINWRGEVVCVASQSGYAANPFRVQWQREAKADQDKRMEFSIALITKKIENSIATMEKSTRRNEAWNKAMEMAYATLTKLDARQPKTISGQRSRCVFSGVERHADQLAEDHSEADPRCLESDRTAHLAISAFGKSQRCASG